MAERSFVQPLIVSVSSASVGFEAGFGAAFTPVGVDEEGAVASGTAFGHDEGAFVRLGAGGAGAASASSRCPAAASAGGATLHMFAVRIFAACARASLRRSRCFSSQRAAVMAGVVPSLVRTVFIA